MHSLIGEATIARAFTFTAELDKRLNNRLTKTKSMKTRLITLGTLTAVLVSLLLLALGPRAYAVSQSAAQSLLHVFVTNWPAIQKTAEQNRDSSGNIKTHEQGTANVNIVNISPIPVIGIGTGSATLPYKTIKVFDNKTLNQGDKTQSDYITVEGYKKAVLFVDSTASGKYDGFNVNEALSIDGANDYGGASVTGNEGAPHVQTSTDVFAPKLHVVAGYHTNPPYNNPALDPTLAPSVTFSATLYLIP